ncbi:MAG: phosphoenolpyruvate--protein phosphotransferase [Veillonellales bacterium]
MKKVSDVLKGVGVVPGVAVGRIKIVSQDIEKHLPYYEADSPAREAEKFTAALCQAREQLGEIIDTAKKNLQKNQADIMEAHLTMLGDPMLQEAVLQKIQETIPAPLAIVAVTQEYAAAFQSIDDPYLQERGADVLDIGRRIARILLNIQAVVLENEPVILAAQDLEPSVLTDLPAKIVQGLILEQGSTTSHTVIIAKAKGLVTIVGVSGLNELGDGTPVALDGTNGTIVISPEQAECASYIARQQADEAQYARDLASATLPAVTVDGRQVQLAANISTPQDMERALQFGSEGVGLYRTEFLFMGRDNLPTEEEQFQAYQAVVAQCGPHICIIRTLDIGGDKPLSYLSIDQESNPFLGWRAIRICLERPDLFLTQLKAILRAGAAGKVAIMLPMVINGSEIRRTRKYLEQAAAELEREGKIYARNVPLGIMVETPAAAVLAPQLARECDFFSIGANDLVQYTLAVDRGNQKISDLYTHFHPAVLQLISNVISSAHHHGIRVGMCGEMAGDPLAAALLTAMGIDELSMSSAALPRVREKIRSIDTRQTNEFLQTILSLDDGGKVREYLEKI